ncbi:MAG: polysaccharide deacetylase family protein [Thermoanaerobacteraceae bacterium]
MKIYYIKYPKKPYIIAIIIIILSIILIGYFLNRSVSVFNTNEPIYKGNTDEKKMAFACNVAWGDEYIKDMLKIFDKSNIKITFFIEGNWAEKNPEMVKEIFNKGHEIGSHGYTHVKYTQWTKEKYAEDIKKCSDLLEKITGQKPKLFAPPYGDFNSDVVKTAENQGYKVILWSLDTIDWNNPSPYTITERVISKAHNDAIVLMHPTKNTVEALPEIIKQLQSKGYQITNVSGIILNKS